jgi:hypothetical protein
MTIVLRSGWRRGRNQYGDGELNYPEPARE